MGGNGYFGLGFEGEAVHEGSTPKDIALRAVKHIQAGVRDAVRVDRSWGLVWGYVATANSLTVAIQSCAVAFSSSRRILWERYL